MTKFRSMRLFQLITWLICSYFSTSNMGANLASCVFERSRRGACTVITRSFTRAELGRRGMPRACFVSGSKENQS